MRWILGCLPTATIFRGQDTRRAVERWKGLVELGHVTTDRWFAFDQINLKAGIGHLKSGLDAGYTATHDHSLSSDMYPAHLERFMEADAGDRGT